MLFLRFQLGGGRYLLEAARVAAVLSLPTLRPLPHAPPGVVGLANYRGTAVPVIDSMVNKQIVHRNKAARHKSRLAARIRGMS